MTSIRRPAACAVAGVIPSCAPTCRGAYNTLRATPRGPLEPTPSQNLHLPFRRGGFQSLCAALDYAAEGSHRPQFLRRARQAAARPAVQPARPGRAGLRAAPDRRRHGARRAAAADRRYLAGLLRRLLRRAICRRRPGAGVDAGRARSPRRATSSSSTARSSPQAPSPSWRRTSLRPSRARPPRARRCVSPGPMADFQAHLAVPSDRP